jgi:diguanylate cyclase (GGDEF)-like protein
LSVPQAPTGRAAANDAGASPPSRPGEVPLRFGRLTAEQMIDANQQLVLAVLRAQAQAEAATRAGALALQATVRSAERDTLTDLPNRVLLHDRLTQAIAAAKRSGVRSALLFLDLDNFKAINDTLGHAVGDQVLKLTASRLVASVRAQDTVSRHGGDEFLILLTEVRQVADAVAIADKVSAALDAPSTHAGHVIRVAASIGISLYPDDGEEAGQLIDRADLAMYHAKRNGLRSFVFRSLPPPVAASRQTIVRHGQARANERGDAAQLRDANEHLVLAVLTAHEQRAASERMQSRYVEVLATVAHELRGPLAPIRQAAELLRRGRADAGILDRVQAIITRQVSHMARLIGDLIDVSRVNTGMFTLERELLDFALLIDHAVDACRPAMDARLQHLSLLVPTCALPFEGDPVRLTQVVCNLLDNASKYTQVGGEIGLVVTAGERDLVLAVSDNGIGISPQSLGKVFEPFVQDHRAVGFNGSGLGIGLSVVRELVEAHGGSVAASSAGTGFGSQFVVTLPWGGQAAK